MPAREMKLGEEEETDFELEAKKLVEALEPGALFEDEEFPCDASQLFRKGNRPPKNHLRIDQIAWLRPSEFAGEDAKVFKDGVEPGDVMQGCLGDCWLLSSLSIAAVKKGYLQKLFVSLKYASKGLYILNFFKDGAWRNVIIDDRIPCHAARKVPLYSRCKDKNEIWVPLVEKAYAKLHGAYIALEGGSIEYGLRDLTAGAPERMEIKPDGPVEKKEGGEDVPEAAEETLGDKLTRYTEEGWLCGCAYAGPGAAETETSQGILRNHAYSVLGVHKVEGHPLLLKIRNPWGLCEWSGRYSDNDLSIWTDGLKAAVGGHKAENDGTFFMSITDFTTMFNQLYVCRVFDEGWIHERRLGSWDADTAGGRVDHPTWTKNEQFPLILKKKTELFIVLTQPDSRLKEGKEFKTYKNGIGFVVSRHPNIKTKLRRLRGKNVVCQSVYAKNRAVSASVTLDADTPYVIIPTTWEPNKYSPFILTVYGDVNGKEKDRFELLGGKDLEDIVEVDDKDGEGNVKEKSKGEDGSEEDQPYSLPKGVYHKKKTLNPEMREDIKNLKKIHKAAGEEFIEKEKRRQSNKSESGGGGGFWSRLLGGRSCDFSGGKKKKKKAAEEEEESGDAPEPVNGNEE